jgi:VanZ family protein
VSPLAVVGLALWLIVCCWLTLVSNAPSGMAIVQASNLTGSSASRLQAAHPDDTSAVAKGQRPAERALNVLLFAPFGALASLVRPGRRRVVPTVLAAAVLASAIEVAQGVRGGGRVGDLEDVVANTIGAALGALAAVGIARRRSRPGTAALRYATSD